MFTKFVLKVLASPAGRNIVRRYTRNMVMEEVAELLEDPTSNTRVGMMRIIRGEVKDVIEENRERAQTFAELDEMYVQWAQERRQALLAKENAERFAAAVAPGAVGTAPEDALAPFVQGRAVKVLHDALYEGATGRVHTTQEIEGYPVVNVLLDGFTMSLPFAPSSLEPMDEQPAAEDAGTELLPVVDQ